MLRRIRISSSIVGKTPLIFGGKQVAGRLGGLSPVICWMMTVLPDPQVSFGHHSPDDDHLHKIAS